MKLLPLLQNAVDNGPHPIVAFFLLISILHPFTVLFHELGHAIAALILTKKKVTAYIGSYGDASRSLKLRLGRLELILKYNFFIWHRGLCVFSPTGLSIPKSLLIIAAGPLVSLVLGTAGCLLLIFVGKADFIKITGIALLLISIYDFAINMYPRKTPICLSNGNYIYNDGEQLSRLFAQRKLPASLREGIDLYNEQQYREAAEKLQLLIDNGSRDSTVLRVALSAYLQVKDYPAALAVLGDADPPVEFDAADYVNCGVVNSFTGEHEQALAYYNRSLELDPENIYALNNRGYTYNLMEQYPVALADFDRVLQINPDFAYALNNRGLARFKTGHEEEGIRDIERSLVLDADNAYAYLNLGIYSRDKGDFETALQHFHRAQEMDRNTHQIEQQIAQTQEKLREAKK